MLRDSIDYKGTAVGKLFRRFLFPTVMGMVFSAVFVITDGIFVGRGIGSDALAAVNLTAPLFTLGTGLGLMFGMGGSVVASINLAQDKRRVAEINITQSLALPALLIALLSALLIHCHEPLLMLLDTPGELMVPAREYLVWFTLFLTPLAVFNILMFIVRLDGAPRFAMACNIMAASINIVLDYLFIFEFGWGLAGAAIATGVGYIVGSGVMLRYMLRHSRTLHFVKFKTSYKSLRLTARNLGYMTYIGFPALLSELAISCLMVVGNYTFIRYTGKDGVAAYSIACYIFPIIFMVYNAIGQSAQPILSYNFGAGNGARVRKAFRLALLTAVAAGLGFFGLTALFSRWIVAMFIDSSCPACAIAVRGLPLFASGFVFFAVNIVSIGYFQSVERPRPAMAVTVLRGFVFMAACFFGLPLLLGVEGIWLAVPLAEALTFAVVAAIYGRTRLKSAF